MPGRQYKPNCKHFLRLATYTSLIIINPWGASSGCLSSVRNYLVCFEFTASIRKLLHIDHFSSFNECNMNYYILGIIMCLFTIFTMKDSSRLCIDIPLYKYIKV